MGLSFRTNRMSRGATSDLPSVVERGKDLEGAVESVNSLNVTEESKCLGDIQIGSIDVQEGHPSEEGAHIGSNRVAHDDPVESLSLQLNQPWELEQRMDEQQSGWDSVNTVEKIEPSGWDDGWHPGTSPEDAAAGSSSGWGLQPGEIESVPYVDLGYFDQDIIILGSSMVVRVAYTAKGVEDWIQKYSPAERLFGVDIEWRPNQFKGDDNKAALLQIAGIHGCLIIQLLYIERIPDVLKELLADHNVKLAGVGVRADCKKLFHDYGLQCRGEVDLGLLAADVFNRRELKQAGLATLSDLVLGIPFKKIKSVCMSNWAVEGLSLSQITYAASDACIAYSVLVSLNAQPKDGPRSRSLRSAKPNKRFQKFLSQNT